MTGAVYLEAMSQPSLKAKLAHVLAMEKASGLPPWDVENFLAEFPEKWQHSRWIRHKAQPDNPVGYAVVSRKTSCNLHLHRLVIATPGKGYGGQAIRLLIKELHAFSPYMTVKTMAGAPRLIRFYERLGFVPIFPADGNMLLLKNLSGMP